MSGSWWHRLFVFGVLLKGLDGVLEMLGGVLLLLASRWMLYTWVLRLTAGEIAEDPHDLMARSLIRLAGHLSASTKLLMAVYLLAHGMVKLFLVVAMLRRHPWAYPVGMTAISALIGYQSYRLSQHFTWSLLAFTGVDLLVVILIWGEYRRLRHAHPLPAPTD